MALRKVTYDLDDSEDARKIHLLLLEASPLESEEDSEARAQEDNCFRPVTHYEVTNEEYDTDASEEIEKRDEDSNTEQSGTDSSSEDDDQEFYNSVRKMGNQVVENISWKKTPYSPSRKAAKHNLLTKLQGVTGNAKNKTTILETWKCLFSDNILETIVKYTNQYINRKRTNYTRERDAHCTDVTEIMAFIGLLYLAGQLKSRRLNLEELWARDGSGIEIFRLTMGLKRFRFLFQSIRFDDRETRAERKQIDHLAPIRDIFEKFVRNCQSCYSVGENVTLDEKLVAFKGKCSFIQYIPSKPIKYGIKIFALVDSKMFYTSHLEIYAGRQPQGPYEVSNKNVDVVERMIMPIHNTGRNVTADSWFGDVTLLKHLSEEHRLSYVGTLKKNKWQIPTAMRNIRHRKVFSSIFGFRKEGTIVSYVSQNKHNKKNILLISSLHLDGNIDGDAGPEKKPEMLTFYNKHKSAVDVLDKMCSTYSVARNTRRWPMVIFFSMLDISGINSQVLFLENGNEVPERRLFLKKLGMELVQGQLLRRSKITTLPLSLSCRLKELLSKEDEPVVKENNNTNISSNSRKRCYPCQKQKVTRLTKYKCKMCARYLCLQHSAYVCLDGCEVKNEILENA